MSFVATAWCKKLHSASLWVVTALLTILAVSLSSILISSCGGTHETTPPASTCAGLHCALLTKTFDVSCPQTSGRNYRTYATSTQASLTVTFFYLLKQFDGQGNLTTFDNTVTLPGSHAVPISCDYDVKNGTQYQYDIVKECATTRAGATLGNCTSDEENLVLRSAVSADAARIESLPGLESSISAGRMIVNRSDAQKLLTTPSVCVDICKLNSRACLAVPFTKDQTKDLDSATSILFGVASKHDLKNCKQSIDVHPDGANGSLRMLTVSGKAKACVIDVNSKLGSFELMIPGGAGVKTAGDQQKYAISPTTDDSPFIKLPIDEWQKKFGGFVLSTEGSQASAILTTENGCIRLERYH